MGRSFSLLWAKSVKSDFFHFRGFACPGVLQFFAKVFLARDIVLTMEKFGFHGTIFFVFCKKTRSKNSCRDEDRSEVPKMTWKFSHVLF